MIDVHLGYTTTELRTGAGQSRISFVAANGVHSSNGRKKIVHVRLHVSIFHLDLFGAATALERMAFTVDAFGMPISPLRKGTSEIFRRYGMFPFNPGHSVFVRWCAEAHGQHNAFLAVKFRSTIKCHSVVIVDISLKHLFRDACVFIGNIACCENDTRENERCG